MSLSRRPAPKDEATGRRLSKQRTRNTVPELAIRRELHRCGLRFRIDMPAPVPGLRSRIDIAFTRSRLAVYVDGCFWHGCPEHFTVPESNRDWWIAKVERNRERDATVTRLLEEHGWTVCRIWEHTDPAEAARQLIALKSEADA